jgi:hypothetical protein
MALPSLTATRSTPPLVWRARRQFAWSIRQNARGLQHPQEMQYDEYDCDDDQNVNNVASFGESGTQSRTESAEQPQHD